MPKFWIVSVVEFPRWVYFSPAVAILEFLTSAYFPKKLKMLRGLDLQVTYKNFSMVTAFEKLTLEEF